MKRKRSGGSSPFTLVEILLVAGMICVLIVLIVVGYNGVYRSWAVRNTVAAMKNVHLVLEKFRLEHGYMPVKSTSWESSTCYDGFPFALCFYRTGDGDWTKTFRYTGSKGDANYKILAQDLVKQAHPYAREFSGGTFKVFDDFGSRSKEDEVHPIYYAYPYLATGTFALFSKGKDGAWGGGDDIIYLPAGLSGKKLPPGFYLVTLSNSGEIQGTADDIEPLGQ